MSNVLKDGTGTGTVAKIGEQNRLHVHSLGADLVDVACAQGKAFDVFTNILTLTSANESGIIYIKNTEDKDILIKSVSLALGASSGGSGAGKIKFYIGVTGGTVLSDANDANLINRRFGDTEDFSGDYYYGGEGKTITCSGGCSFETPTASGVFESTYVIPKNTAIGISYTPATGNTSQDIRISLLVIKNAPRYTYE